MPTSKHKMGYKTPAPRVSPSFIRPGATRKLVRHSRSAILNITLFVLALFLILYLNSSSKSDPKDFAWTKVRYQTASDVLPESRGICPGLSSTSKKPVLVVARTSSESDAWLKDLSSLYHACTYTADAAPNLRSNQLQTPANRGHESMAYLTFIIDNYNNLPKSGMVFVHGSRFAWHNDDPIYDNLSLLKQLNVTRALWGPPGPATGYWNMKCDWSAGMCDAKSGEAKPQGSMETQLRAIIEPQNRRAISDAGLVDALSAIFGGSGTEASTDEGTIKLPMTLGRNDAVRSQCCAQFVVARENIWRHSKEEYVALRQWLLDGSQAGLTTSMGQQSQRNINSEWPAPADDYVAGRILSYVWHILFLPPIPQQEFSSTAQLNLDPNAGINLDHLNRLACPRADECYCRLYGRCNLRGCTVPGRCWGQYSTPPNYKLPKDWAETHS